MATTKKTGAATGRTERLRMEMELADNGVILRNPDCEDEVTLAVTPREQDRTGYGNIGLDITDANTAIGRKVYDWLMDVVIPESEHELIITGFTLLIEATPNGRPMPK